MKICLDEGLPLGAVAQFKALGFDAYHVLEHPGAGTTDAEILDHARQKEAVVVTLDADFHALLALSQAIAPSVIRLRIEGLKAAALTALLIPLLRDYAPELAAGVAMSVDERFVRFQRLPLGATSRQT